MNLGKRLKIVMAVKEVRSKDLAYQLGVSPAQICNWRRANKFSANTLSRICKCICITEAEFYAISSGAE